MSDATKKPAWVEALGEAQTMLRSAAEAVTPEAADSRTRLAYGWMDVAKMLKGDRGKDAAVEVGK